MIDKLIHEPVIYTTGFGKSGVVARLFAENCSTLGVACNFVNPADIEHGGGGRLFGRKLLLWSASGRSISVPPNCELILVGLCPGLTNDKYGLPQDATLLQVKDAFCLAEQIAEKRGIRENVLEMSHPAK